MPATMPATTRPLQSLSNVQLLNKYYEDSSTSRFGFSGFGLMGQAMGREYGREQVTAIFEEVKARISDLQEKADLAQNHADVGVNGMGYGTEEGCQDLIMISAEIEELEKLLKKIH